LLALQVIAAERAAAAAIKLAEQADAAQRSAAADAKQQAGLAARVQVELDTTVAERMHAQRQLAATEKQVGGRWGVWGVASRKCCSLRGLLHERLTSCQPLRLSVHLPVT
jgi:hypothetical protein